MDERGRRKRSAFSKGNEVSVNLATPWKKRVREESERREREKRE